MKCLVVYESMYGNTHEIATAIGRGITHLGAVQVVPVGDIASSDVGAVDLLVVGGPTHVHGMTRASTRRAAIDEAEQDDELDLDPDAPGPGLREWLATIASTSSAYFAAFDTRIDKPVILVGSAAKGISKRLARRGYLEVVEPQSFFVEDSSGPLRHGEESRALEWARGLANDLTRLKRHDAAAHSQSRAAK